MFGQETSQRFVFPKPVLVHPFPPPAPFQISQLPPQPPSAPSLPFTLGFNLSLLPSFSTVTDISLAPDLHTHTSPRFLFQCPKRG